MRIELTKICPRKRLLATLSVLMFVTTFIFIPISDVSAAVPPSVEASIRNTAVNCMSSMKNASWIAGFTWTSDHGSYNYTSGVRYSGIPYAWNYNTTLGDFNAMINNSGNTLTANAGIDCSTAAIYSWNAAGSNIPNPADYNTTSIITGAINNNNYIRRVGTYNTSGCSTTSGIFSTSKNTKTTLTTAYSKLEIGDVCVHNDTNGAHAIVVTAVFATSINYIDQGQGSLSNTPKTSWSTGTYSFDTLYSKMYIPVTSLYFNSLSA